MKFNPIPVPRKSTILRDDVSETLYDYQINKVEMMVRDMQTLNKESAVYHQPCRCPKCGAENPTWTKGGKANSGKPMIKCSECKHRITIDYGQLTWYSHQDESQWNAVIADTFNDESLNKTAADIDVHPDTAFRMRHKLLVFLGKTTDCDVLSAPSELDETFFRESHKGLPVDYLPPRKRGGKTDKNGISDDLVCLTTGVERQGTAYVQAYNMGRPSSDEVEPLFKDHVNPGTFFWVDGERCFPPLFDRYHCDYYTIKSGTKPDQVNHLNNVNSFHDRIKDLYRHYRGVATVYINRYANLFSLKQKFLGYDIQEIVLKVIKVLHKHMQFFLIKNLKDTHLFYDPAVMVYRNVLRFAMGHVPAKNDSNAVSRLSEFA